MASLARVSAFFRLPSLLIFEAERIVDEDLYHLQGWTCPMGSSSITTIKLLDCAFGLRPAGTLELHPVMQTPYLVHICLHRIL